MALNSFVTRSSEFFADSEGLVERGERVIHFGEFLELFKDGGRYVVQTWDSIP